ncbi:hypothetical protein CF326_g2367 [Tilletia indica]|nr:hypothetical protein CF326_g2367 [Tilletia indica]
MPSSILAFLFNTLFDFPFPPTSSKIGTARRWQRSGRQDEVSSLATGGKWGRLRRQSEGRSGTAKSNKTTDGDTAAIYDATTGERLGIDKTGRVVTKSESSSTSLRSLAFIRTGTAPQDTRDKRDGPASTSTRQDEKGEGDGDGCGERRSLPQSAARRRLATSQQRPRFGAAGPRSATHRDNLGLVFQGPRRRCGDESRGMRDKPDVPRNRADIDSDGKAEDAGRLGLRQEQMTTARGVKAHSPLTRAVRRGRRHRRLQLGYKTKGRLGREDVQRGSPTQTVRRGGKTAFSYVGDNVNLMREGEEAWRQYKDQGYHARSATPRLMRRSGTSTPAGPRGRHSPTQKVRRGGETTAGDLTAAKAKVRSARGKVRDVLEMAWPVRRDEDAVQLSGRWTVNDEEPAYKRQGLKTGGKARESTATAPPARQDGGRLGREGRTVTAKTAQCRWINESRTARRMLTSHRAKKQDWQQLEQQDKLYGRQKQVGDMARSGGSRPAGQDNRDSAATQTVRRDGETTGDSLTAKAKVSIIEAQPRLIFTSSRSINPTAGADDMFMFFPILTISVHAISASVYRSGLVMPTILDRIHQALSAQLCNEEFFKGTVEEGPRTFQAHDLLTFLSFALIQDLKPQATRARLTATPDGKRRNARSLASAATVEQGSKTEDDSVKKTDRFKVSRRKARPPISPQ